jgi:hypothetical protein
MRIAAAQLGVQFATSGAAHALFKKGRNIS